MSTALACLLVLLALVAPADPRHLTPAAFVGIPLEGLLLVAVLLVLPSRWRGVAAVTAGVLLGVLSIVRVLDLGFASVLDRRFDLVMDWPLLGNGLDFLTESVGRPAALGVAVVAAALAVAVPWLVAASVLRLSRLVVHHRRLAVISGAVLGAAWLSCAALGVQVVAGQPLAASNAIALTRDHTVQVRTSLHDQEVYSKELATDRFRASPNGELMSALRGKDVILAFVESYGRSAVEGPTIAPLVGPVLDAGTRRLRAAGFDARSGWLGSPTVGSGSWLAHSTLLSGTWVDNQQRYDRLLSTDRLTLTGAFRRAGWRTVAVLPGTTEDWPQGSFYGYDQVYAARDLGYRGPKFTWATMPDQYALSALHRLELAQPDHPPVMAEVEMVSSHGPWAPIPSLVGWDEIGDGSVFGPMPAAGKQPADVWRDPSRVRTEYARSIEYSLNSLISYVETYGTKNTVLVFVGDHQASSIITGSHGGRDVPITVVAHDPSVLRQMSGWGWQGGLRPGPSAPVWPMSAFRDRFLAAFSPAAQ